MKAIVVVDIPRYCAECQCCYGFICFPLAREMGMWAIHHGKPVDCPLKPMPKEFGIDVEDDYARGWNDCLKEITK